MLIVFEVQFRVRWIVDGFVLVFNPDQPNRVLDRDDFVFVLVCIAVFLIESQMSVIKLILIFIEDTGVPIVLCNSFIVLYKDYCFRQQRSFPLVASHKEHALSFTSFISLSPLFAFAGGPYSHKGRHCIGHISQCRCSLGSLLLASSRERSNRRKLQ